MLLALSCSSGPKSKSGSPLLNKVNVKPEGKGPDLLTHEEAQTRAKQVARVGYQLWFAIDPELPEYSGRSVLFFVVRDKAPGSSVTVDFKGGKIQNVTVNGTVWDSEKIGKQSDFRGIRIPLSELSTGSNRVEIAFTHPFSTSGDGLHRSVDPLDGKTYLYTNLEPFRAHQVFPCFDQPDLKATFELTAQVPDGWTVISNTLEREVAKVDGQMSWQFPMGVPLSTYLFALHAGPYVSWKNEWNGIPLRLMARRSLAKSIEDFKTPAEWFDITKFGLEFFTTDFGTRFPFTKYDQIIVPDFNISGMENAAAVTFTERFAFRQKPSEAERRRRASVILHEMAHMWFGDYVTMKWWNDLWLNESFATYYATIALDGYAKFSGVWQHFSSDIKEWAYSEDLRPLTFHPVVTPVRDTQEALSNFDAITYGKGAAVLHQLRTALGEENFREGLQRYFQKYAYRTATLDDFIRMLGEASGKDLKPWQRSWLETSGVDTVKAEWKCDGKKLSELKLVSQRANGNPLSRKHHTRIALFGAKAKKITQIPAEYGEGTTVISIDGSVACPEFVWPNDEDVDYAQVNFDERSLASVESFLKNANAWQRNLVWSVLTRMAQVDHTLSSDRYQALLVALLPVEKDLLVFESLMGSIGTHFWYLPESKRAEAIAAIEGIVLKLMKTSGAGSNAQLTIWKGFVNSVARSSKARALMLDWLHGRQKLSGFDLGVDRRWDLLEAIARIESVSEIESVPSLIEAELKRDSSRMGKRKALGVLVSQPVGSIKKEWLDRVLNSHPQDSKSAPRYEMADLKVVVKNLQRPGAAPSTGSGSAQESLLLPHLDQILAALPQLSKQEDTDLAEIVAGYTIPWVCETSVRDRLRSWIQSNAKDVTPVVLRSLQDAATDIDRCVQARGMGR